MSNIKRFSSRKEVTEFLATKGIDTSNWSEEKWLSINKGQAEIHMMALAEAIYDTIKESTPKQLKAGEYHIPFQNKILELYSDLTLVEQIKISVGMAANTSYTVVGDGSIITIEKATRIHDKCKELNHSSVFEHCARAMSDEEYFTFRKGDISLTRSPIGTSFYLDNDHTSGWCKNYKGFIQYRHLIETK